MDMTKITKTKIALPRRRRELMTRQRLIDALLDNLLDRRVIYVTAPAGYGKTSLLIDVAHHTDLPVCWYAIDAFDVDPQRFIMYFIAAIAHQFPEFGQRAATFIENTEIKASNIEQLITIIINEIYDAIVDDFIVVLDDFHLVQDDEIIGAFISRLLQQVNDNCHLIVTTRKLVDLSDWALMLGRSWMKGLGIYDLKFQADEVKNLILRNYKKTISDAEAEHLIQETEGWVTGLLFAMQTEAKHFGADIYDYLAEQILAQQTPEIQDFLLRTSLLEEFDDDLCQTVLGTGNWNESIEKVAKNNLFVLRVNGSLRYHNLLQEFLRHRIKTQSPAQAGFILRRLADLYLSREQWQEAYDIYYEQLADTEATVSLVERVGFTLVKRGRLALLGKMIDSLPKSTLYARPKLLALRGTVAIAVNQVSLGISMLDDAEILCQKEDDVYLLARTLAWRAVGHRFLAQYQKSLNDAEAVLNLTSHHKNLFVQEAEAYRAKAMVFYRKGALTQAIKWGEIALRAYHKLDDEQNAVTVLRLELGLMYSDIGRYNQALIYYQQAGEYWQEKQNITWLADLNNSLGILHYCLGDYEQAEYSLKEAIRYAEQSGYLRIKAYALASLGDLYIVLDAEASLSAHQQAYDLARQLGEKFLLFYTKYAQALIGLRQSDLMMADIYLKEALDLKNNTSDYENGLYQLGVGQLALKSDRLTEAVDHLQKAYQLLQDRPTDSIQAGIQLAQAYYTKGEQSAAFEVLGAVLALGTSLDHQHILVLAASEAQTLFKQAKCHEILGIRAEQIWTQVIAFQRYLPALRRQMRHQSPAIPLTPSKLKIRTLGPLQIKFNNELLSTGAWQAKVARDLFLYLLTRPSGASKDTIGLTFWPNHSPEQLNSQFKKTMYRLRQVLGREAVLLDEVGHYYFNPNLDYDYDVEAFDMAIQQAETLTDVRDKIANYEIAINIYQGLFLAELDWMWVLVEQERLSKAYKRAILQLVEFYQETREHSRSLAYCELGLTEDPTAEEIHRLAMRSYVAVGDYVAVARQFETCQRILDQEVSLPVSPETKNLYETIMMA